MLSNLQITECSRFRLIRLVAFIGLIFPNLGFADFYAAVGSPRLLNFNIGEVEILDSESNPRYGIEYRHLPFGKWHLIPSVGFAVSENDASYLYGELRRDFRIGTHWLFTSSFGAGLFENGKSLALGHKVEFRSGIELAYTFNSGHRLAVSFFHLSNGSISDDNPGTEALVFAAMMPLKSK